MGPTSQGLVLITMSPPSVGVSVGGGGLPSNRSGARSPTHPWIFCVCQQRKRKSTEDHVVSLVETRPRNEAITLPTFCRPEFLHVAAPTCKGFWESCVDVCPGAKKTNDDRETHDGICHMWNYLHGRRERDIQNRRSFRNGHTRI